MVEDLNGLVIRSTGVGVQVIEALGAEDYTAGGGECVCNQKNCRGCAVGIYFQRDCAIPYSDYCRRWRVDCIS